MKAGSVVFGMVILAGASFATDSVTGTWHGKIQFDMSSLPKLKNPHQNTARLKALNQIQADTLTLTLKDNKTYSLATAGAPKMTPLVRGVWSTNGTTVSLQRMENGKEFGFPQVYVINKAQRTLSVTKTSSGITTTVNFFR